MTARPAFFDRSGDDYLPTEIGNSIWNPGTVGGLAVSGLLASLIEAAPPAEGLQVARLTIDILGQVPRQRLGTRVSMLRPGKRMALTSAELLVDGRAAARATALWVRDEPTPPSPPRLVSFPAPLSVPLAEVLREDFAYGAIRTRPVYGSLYEAGPGALWVAFDVDMVRGVPVTPFARAAMLADFGNGVGSMLPGEPWSFANLDICLHFLRPPRGEWVLIEAETDSAGTGYALARNLFADEDGVYAYGFQTLFVAPSEPNGFR